MTLDYEIFDAGDIILQRGATIRDCKLAYKTFGTLNEAKDNCIVYPTWYSGQHYENEWLIGEGHALDPSKYFIIIPNMLGNGLSSSPSNTPEPYNLGSSFKCNTQSPLGIGCCDGHTKQAPQQRGTWRDISRA
jgi:homoserine O-acetyltransferase